jgi:hypothetical protein
MRSIEIIGEKVLPEIQSWKTPGGITVCEPDNAIDRHDTIGR